VPWTEADIPDQSGRVALITGANSGIGFEAARALAEHGAAVVLACRNRAKADAAVASIAATAPHADVSVLEVDLADLDQVTVAAATYASTHDRLDLLVNNAGLMAIPRRTTAQGYEMQFAVNHLAHFALTGRLLDRLLATPGSRVVSVSSQGHRPGRIDFDDLQLERSYGPWRAYFRSKLANLLFVAELQRRLSAADATTMALAAHPGGSRTHLMHENPGGIVNTIGLKARPAIERVVMQSAAMGALPTLYAATADVPGAAYIGPDGLFEQRGHPKLVDMSGAAKNADNARRLWELSEELTGVSFALPDGAPVG
jgi:NAD(P)-dependent dehydrogenase (short-subunit alcohol dehydrogenase family)